ncbi:DUF2842 domain-containing protein [Rhodobacteraceae bacterium RKSG542]|uniref:DUF2842 domain-containing protein n=1 Tax=Pseudovibrio flavus TaxID=2529854 RepID=UPI0012BD2C82|nr:DUF2842 domain-containing protein [Pseudovibrio flavus]MTI17348.1 DUF2842 domain-containing protein [Pseudovibrio flavus]
MSSSLRRFIGMVALVLFVIVYCFIALVIGDLTMVGKHWAVQITYFAIAGLVWIFPAHSIIKWMYKKG